jgi:hypothetical protein
MGCAGPGKLWALAGCLAQLREGLLEEATAVWGLEAEEEEGMASGDFLSKGPRAGSKQ